MTAAPAADSNFRAVTHLQAPADFGLVGQICTIPACGHILFRIIGGWVCRYASASCKKLAVDVAAAPGCLAVMPVETIKASTVTASTRS